MPIYFYLIVVFTALLFVMFVYRTVTTLIKSVSIKDTDDSEVQRLFEERASYQEKINQIFQDQQFLISEFEAMKRKNEIEIETIKVKSEREKQDIIIAYGNVAYAQALNFYLYEKMNDPYGNACYMNSVLPEKISMSVLSKENDYSSFNLTH